MQSTITNIPPSEAVRNDVPRGVPGLGLLGRMRKDPLRFFTEMSRDYGDVVPLKMGPQTIYLVNHPDHIQRVFRDNRDNYVRSKYYGQFAPIIGEGLFTLEGKAWRKQRKVSQPGLSGPNLIAMVGAMVRAIQNTIARFERHAKTGTAFDVMEEASRLTLDIVLRALFTARLNEERFVVVFDSLTTILREIEKRVWEVIPRPFWLPTERNYKLKDASRRLNQVMESLVASRLQKNEKPGDMLDLLIAAERAAGWDQNSVKSIRDQVLSIVIAGHETGAIAFSWLCYELSKNPSIARRVREEADQVLGDSVPGFPAFQSLEYTQRVFKEILRLYPPLWTVSRVGVEDDYLGRTKIPKGEIVMLCPYTIHRHSSFWPNPEGFDPDRFLPSTENSRHPFSYFPFGGGPHLCLGNRFAVIEGVLMLAMIFRRFDFELVPGQKIEPAPMTTLRPAGPLRIRARSLNVQTTLAA